MRISFIFFTCVLTLRLIHCSHNSDDSDLVITDESNENYSQGEDSSDDKEEAEDFLNENEAEISQNLGKMDIGSHQRRKVSTITKLDTIPQRKQLIEKIKMKYCEGSEDELVISWDLFSTAWLEQLEPLSLNSLKILLLPEVTNQLFSVTFQHHQTLLKGFQSKLCPANFFPMGIILANVPAIQSEIFMLLPFDEISRVLIEKVGLIIEKGILSAIKESLIIEKLRNSIVKIARRPLLEILDDKVPKLAGISKTTLELDFNDYESLLQWISNNSEKLKCQSNQVSTVSPPLAQWFAASSGKISRQNKQSSIKTTPNIPLKVENKEEEANKIRYMEMAKNLIGYRPYQQLLRFAIRNNHLNELIYIQLKEEQDGHAWTLILDKVLIWLIQEKGYSLKRLLTETFGFLADIKEPQKPFTSWEQVAVEYLKVSKSSFPNNELITSYEQLETLNILSWRVFNHASFSDMAVKNVCMIIKHVLPHEFKEYTGEDPYPRALDNLYIGTIKAMEGLIAKQKALLSFLETVFLEHYYAYPFLETLLLNENGMVDSVVSLKNYLFRLEELKRTEEFLQGLYRRLSAKGESLLASQLIDFIKYGEKN